MNQSLPCPYCGGIGYHTWAGEGGCPSVSLPRMENPFEAEHYRLMQEVAVLKALLTRAADSLDIMTQFLLVSNVSLEWEENKRRENTALIAELRKVSELSPAKLSEAEPSPAQPSEAQRSQAQPS